jgi:polysaccharide pyruvyl transferase WcaK-like protein
MFTHLRGMAAVFVRESLSRDYLASHGVSENVHLMSDPGFVMKPKDPGPARLGFEIPEGAIGLNFSPLIAKYFIGEDLPPWELREEHIAPWASFCVGAVQQLSAATGREIVLIPHVGSALPGIDDFRFLAGIAKAAAEKAPHRVMSVPDGLSAEELKAVIAKCDVFAGARTHSTIAAISSGVPTLSLGYSLKSRGLNEDIFGSQDYCLDTSKLTLETFLEGMARLLDNRDSISNHLRKRLPRIVDDAFAAGPLLRRALENEVSGSA